MGARRPRRRAHLATGIKVGGAIGLGIGIYFAEENIRHAPEGERARVAAEETGGLGYGILGSVIGGELGGAAVVAGAALLGATPVGWAILAGAVVGSLIGGYLFSKVGRGVGRGLYDSMAE